MNRAVSVLLLALFAGAPASAEPLDALWFARTVPFTASGYDGESTLENFPVLVRLSGTDVAGFRHDEIGSTTNDAYAALRFADAAGNSLDYEIEEWNPGGTSFVWVSLPSLAGTDTRFSAFYKPAAGTALPAVRPTNVWTSAGYVGVWHLNAIRKNHAGAYKNYDDPLWGHVFPDSTGLGADATKATTGWNTSLMNVPADAGGFHFPESLGRANGTLGANGYTPFMIPSPAEGGGTSGWTFSGTGYSAEAWIHPFGIQHSIFVSGQSSGYAADNFLHFGTNDVRIAANDWGGTGVGWNPGRVGETGVWHFVTAVWTPAGSSAPTTLHGTSGAEAPHVLLERDVHATDQFAAEGMRFTAQSGIEFGLDEMRVRRGLSTPDWIQANWDAQRAGSDFLVAGAVRDPREPVVSGITATSATASLDHPLSGTVRALFVEFATKATNEVAVADPAHPAATASGLSPDTDYDVLFVAEEPGGATVETPSAPFVTAGRPAVSPRAYRHAATFTATGYDGAETLERFPVLVRISETAVPGFSYVGANPETIRFVAADGSLLAHEVEVWDPDGTSSVWVALPALSGRNTSFTMLWAPYDDAGVAAQPAYRVWKYAGYVGVWHVNGRVAADGRLCYGDSSGGGAVAAPAGGDADEPAAAGSWSANGTPWTTANGGRTSALATAGWTFSRTGYSVECWISTRDRPGYTVKEDGTLNSRNGYLFASEAKTENGAERQWAPSNGLQFYMTHVNLLGGLVFPAKTTATPYWLDDATNGWHFVSAVWTPEGDSGLSKLYEAGESYSSHGTNLRLLQTIDRRAIDFDGPRGMGVFGSSDFQGNGCYYDEARVRRGLSTPDWIQASWDTQRLGTDFLTAGPVTDYLLPSLFLIR